MSYTPPEPFYCGKTKTEDVLNTAGKVIGTKTFTCKNKAKNATEEIDIVGIVAGCEALAEYAESILDIIAEIKFDFGLITKDVLSVNGTDISGLAAECQGDMNTSVSTNIIENVKSVRATAIANFKAKQELYDTQAENKCHIWE